MPQTPRPEAKRQLAALAGLRIALVAPSLSAHGGSEEYLQAIAPALEAAGAKVKVFTGSPDERNESHEDALNLTLNPLRKAALSKPRQKFARQIAASFDVVDFQRIAPLALVRELKGKVPSVLTVHTVEHTCPAGSRYLPKSGALCDRKPSMHCVSHDRREGCLCFANGRPFSVRDKAHAFFQLRASKGLFAHVDFAIYNSKAARLCCETHLGRPQGHVVHPPLLAPKVENPKRVPHRLVFVGRLEPFKGALDLPDVLLAQGTQATLEIIGEGSALRELKHRVAERKLSHRVSFRGWLGRDDVANALAQASCLVFPSRGFEAWGMAGPEAIAQGCPVAAYEGGGVSEWCTRQFGALAPLGNVSALALCARQWLEKMAAGLDTSSWRGAAEKHWGMERWLAEYAQALTEARRGRD
jgi:glycosyltransferase involved in cell wall biosynthesis